MTRLARPIENANGLVGDIVSQTPSSYKQKMKEEFFLEIKIKLPGGGTLKLKKEPMPQGRFEALCWLAGILLVGFGILKFFSLLI